MPDTVIISTDEYNKIKAENQRLRGEVAEMTHMAEAMRAQVEARIFDIKQLRAENQRLREALPYCPDDCDCEQCATVRKALGVDDE